MPVLDPSNQGKIMSDVAKWFERKFEFSFPVELYPNLCIRLRGTPARLEELLRDWPGESRIKKPEGKWSAQEQAGHLLSLEPLWLARVDDYLAGRSELTVADLSNRGTDEANYNARAITGILADFRTARLRLVDRVNKLDASLFGRSVLHPRLKTPMRLVDHLYFVAEHDDHHLAKIWELGGIS
jgi:DinB superfamily